MPQLPIGQAQRLLENAGYSARMSRKKQGRLVVRGRISASLAVIEGGVSQERVRRLIELSRYVGNEAEPSVNLT